MQTLDNGEKTKRHFKREDLNSETHRKAVYQTAACVQLSLFAFCACSGSYLIYFLFSQPYSLPIDCTALCYLQLISQVGLCDKETLAFHFPRSISEG